MMGAARGGGRRTGVAPEVYPAQPKAACPLCTHALDAVEAATRLCACGYQVCAFCFHQLEETAAAQGVSPRCPACRAVSPAPQLRAPLPHLPAAEEDLLADDGAGARRRRDPRGRALRGIEDAAEGTALERRRLAHVRVIQRNLVYVVGLTMAVCREEVRAPATSSGLEPLKCCVSGARFLALRSGAFRARASRARATRSCSSGRTTSASSDASSRCGLRRAQRSSGAASATRRFIRDGWRYQPRTGAARGRPRTAARSPRPCCRFARPAHGHFCRFSGIQRSAARTAWRH